MTDQNFPGSPEDQSSTTTSRMRGSRGLKAAGLVAAGVIAGGTLAASMSAMAAENPTPSPTTSSNGESSGSANGTAPAPGARPDGGRGPGGPAAVRSDEKVLTGTDLAKAKAAALKAVPGGTVVRAETDAGDGEYEVHMTKADGTLVTVKLDKNFAVSAVEDGMGKGDPNTGGPQGQGPRGPAPSGQAPSGQAPGGEAPGTTSGTSNNA